ncbi:MAG: tRNA pseudouridine(13) synthase TruD, partial [Rhodanobacteraceae bacterium]|nr:tRNA pseudouridine(13) synthase TruD [Rhodanobacteraceae bacterium]
MSQVLPHAHGGPPLLAELRREPGDFRVEEVLGFEPDGSGEH